MPIAETDYSHVMLTLLYYTADNAFDPEDEACPGTLPACSAHYVLHLSDIQSLLSTSPTLTSHVNNGVSIGGMRQSSSDPDITSIPDYSYSSKQAAGFQVLSYLTTSDTSNYNSSSTTQLGGIANALSQSTLGLTQAGTLAQTMMFGPPNMGSCDCSFRDALSTLIASINQLTFLTAAALIDRSPISNVTRAGDVVTVVGVTENTTTSFTALPDSSRGDVVHYRTHYLYLALGIGSTIVCIVLVLPTFWRYGELGRPFTLGPMEIASAFRAAMLETGDAGAGVARDLDQLIEQVVERTVVYGFVEEDRRESVDDGDPAGNRRSVRSCMEEPTKVRPVSGVWAMIPTTPSTAKFGGEKR
ncbi:hypothetical protein LTR70_000875 [Exophiala xenobiotica]|uniref:Uncharacterized protein n=1 Tax=Lithohypha guttulata TaxID=1690604 RepID=A0ABR0KLA0_9EURO|nr:hypothetical protein LTR24_001631 [Lithohypha guttulata]KAK5329039.1 hypothetical protein LTR70_000875 [Exophiala xenobiotica]